MHRTRSRAQTGFTLAELLMGVVVFVVAVIVLGNHITVNYSTTNHQRDKVFAYTRAQAILSEIHAFVDRGEVEAAVDLDVLDDGIGTTASLTVARDNGGTLLPPDHALSGNIQRDGQWVWARRISVRPFSGLNNRNVRYVTVRILKRARNGDLNELASLSSVVNSVGSSFPTAQVFDVYLLAVENVPGWWVFMEAIVPFVESAITDLENRNPGLTLRTHWITKLGFGRNHAYRPYVNDQLDSHETVDSVYWYPGRMPSGNASTFYYVPDLIHGRVLVDGEERGGYDPDTNPYPYSLADFYNHCQRYPRAKAYHETRAQAIRDRRQEIRDALAAGTPPPPEFDDMSEEPPLHVLLEDMASDPDLYRHALLVNLHGELLPAPPMRNYSDPAKLPDQLPNVRVVAHPEELRTARPELGVLGSGDDVRIRFYAYKTDPDQDPATDRMPLFNAMLVQVMDLDLTQSGWGLAPGVQLLCCKGGVPVDSVMQDYRWEAARLSWDPLVRPDDMFFESYYIDPGPGERKYTLFALFNTPLVCREYNNRGLRNDRRSRLYDMEYIPSCTETALDFSRDLTAIGTGPKNTARWILQIPKTVFQNQRFVDTAWPANRFNPLMTSQPDQTITVRTRIWDSTLPDPFATGSWPSGSNPTILQPANFSETYTWWSDSKDDVPVCERSQFLGDPRHNPYKDLWHDDPDFGDGYNWFFDSLTNDSENAKLDYPGIDRSFNRFNRMMRQDVARSFEMTRTALVNSESIFTTLTGYSYYYVGYGNEIGYDAANGYSNSIPVNLHPWGGGDNSTGYVNNITGRRCYIRQNGGGGDYWWGMPWLGELYPDYAYDRWFATDIDGNIIGNLNADDFYRQACYAAYWNSRNRTWGTRMYDAIQRTSSRGCVSMFNIGTSSSHFNHHFSGSTGALVGGGVEIADNYGFPIPATTYINRPFTLDTGGNVPEGYDSDPYASERFSGEILARYYSHGNPDYTGSGLVQLADPTDTNACYIIVNGLAQTAQTGSAFIAKFSMLSMFQSYFELGDTALTHRIKQPPRVEIVSPTEITELVRPTSIDVQVEATWVRWDRLPYTADTPTTFAEDESEIVYVVMYSPDNGDSWLFLQDDTPAEPGVRPTDPTYIVPDQGPGTEVFSWSTPSSEYPEGSYMLRVDAYRDNQALHYSTHQVKIYVER